MNMMKKWMFVVLVAAMVGLAGCGDGDDDVPTGDNNGQLQDTGSQQDTTPGLDAGPDADEPQDAGEDGGDTDDGGLADGGDANDGGDAADDETPTYSDDISYREYREATVELLVSLACTTAWECESEAVTLMPYGHRFDSQEACEEALGDADMLDPGRDRDTDQIESSIDAGRIIFDSEQGAFCLNMIADLTTDEICDPVLIMTGEECSDGQIFTGTIGEGGTCIDSDECAGHSYCSTPSDSCEGTCRLFGSSDCDGDECSDDEFCNSTEDPSVCETRKTEGSQCNANSECGEGLDCMVLDDDERGVCRPLGSRQRGESCSNTYFCEGTDRCIEETCVEFEFVEQGDPCEPRDLCEPGTLCQVSTTDAVVGTCEPPVEVGESCSDTVFCEFGLFCDGATNEQMGSCAVLKADGATCDSGSECESSICEEDTCGDDSPLCPVPS